MIIYCSKLSYNIVDDNIKLKIIISYCWWYFPRQNYQIILAMIFLWQKITYNIVSIMIIYCSKLSYHIIDDNMKLKINISYRWCYFPRNNSHIICQWYFSDNNYHIISIYQIRYRLTLALIKESFPGWSAKGRVHLPGWGQMWLAQRTGQNWHRLQETSC